MRPWSIFICICCVVLMSVTTTMADLIQDLDADIYGVKRRLSKNADALIRFGKRRIYQQELINEYDDDMLDDYLEKRGSNKADMMMRFGRAGSNADKMLRFGRVRQNVDKMIRFG